MQSYFAKSDLVSPGSWVDDSLVQVAAESGSLVFYLLFLVPEQRKPTVVVTAFASDQGVLEALPVNGEKRR